MLENLLRVCLFLLIVAIPDSANALDVPPLKGRVNDYADLLPSARAQALERRLEQFENNTGHQIAVLTIPSLQGEDIEGFSIRVAENWKVGKKGFDNGAILAIAHKDRRLRIEVGYGLEGVLPDAIANRIINDVIVPRFRAGDFPGGIEAGVEAIMKVTSGEPLPESTRKKPSTSSYAAYLPPLLLFGLFFILLINRWQYANGWSTRGRRGHYGGFFPGGGWGGGGFGGGGGGGFSGGGGGFGGGGASGSW